MENELTGAAVAPVQPENAVIPPYKSYQEYKTALDNEVRQEFEGYVRIGYLLKLARDTNILYESGYKDLYEFANAEYHLDKSRVSRYMAINDRFALDGYSMELKEEYKGFGIAKLQLMLQLPDAINEGLTPEYTKSEIQAIKDEVDEENKVSDIERMLEAQPVPAESRIMIGKVIMQLAKDEPELYLQLAKTMKDIWSIEDVKEIMAPDRVKTYSVRIPSTGRIMLMLDDSKDARIVNTRTGKTEETGWGDIGREWETLTESEKTPEEHWEELYCEPFPKEDAPPLSKKVTKVTKAKPDRKPPKAEIKAIPDHISEEPEETEQLPGQQKITDYPEALPEKIPEEDTEVLPPVTEAAGQPEGSSRVEDREEPEGSSPAEDDTAETSGTAEGELPEAAEKANRERALSHLESASAHLKNWIHADIMPDSVLERAAEQAEAALRILQELQKRKAGGDNGTE